MGSQCLRATHWWITQAPRLRDGALRGVVEAVGRHPSRGLLLAHWVELRRTGGD